MSIEQGFNNGVISRSKRKLFVAGNKESWSQRAPYIDGHITFGAEDVEELGCSLAKGRMSVERRNSGLLVLAFEAEDVLFSGFRFEHENGNVERLETDQFSRLEVHETPDRLQMYTGMPEDLKLTDLTQEQLALSSNLLQVEACLTWQEKIDETPEQVVVE